MRCGGPGLCSECTADASRVRAALAQPSPKCATCNDSGQIVVSGPHYQGEFQPPEYETEPCDMCAQPSPAQAEQAEAERPEVVARVVHSNPVVLGQCGPLNANDELMTVAQHAASVARWAEMFNRVEQQRDAALARVAELEKQEPAGAPMPDEIHQMAFEEGQPAEDGDGYIFSAEEFDLFVQRLLDSCAAPVAQAQPEETPGEILAAKLIETWVTKHGKPAPWSTAVEITAVATNMPNDERDRLLALDDDVDAQALREERDSQQRVAINAMEELAALRAMVVVVPERKLLNAGVPGLNRNSGWNACLDELARLNGKTVSEGLLRLALEFIMATNCQGSIPLGLIEELRALLNQDKENGNG